MKTSLAVPLDEDDMSSTGRRPLLVIFSRYKPVREAEFDAKAHSTRNAFVPSLPLPASNSKRGSDR